MPTARPSSKPSASSFVGVAKLRTIPGMSLCSRQAGVNCLIKRQAAILAVSGLATSSLAVLAHIRIGWHISTVRCQPQLLTILATADPSSLMWTCSRPFKMWPCTSTWPQSAWILMTRHPCELHSCRRNGSGKPSRIKISFPSFGIRVHRFASHRPKMISLVTFKQCPGI